MLYTWFSSFSPNTIGGNRLAFKLPMTIDASYGQESCRGLIRIVKRSLGGRSGLVAGTWNMQQNILDTGRVDGLFNGW